MLLAILGDMHIGMRNDRPVFHEYYRKFYHDVFFPYLKNNNINQIVQVGDVFDRRKFINFNSLHLARQDIFDYSQQMGLIWHVLVGNHDIYYKNTLDVNSLHLLLGSYSNIFTYLRPTSVEFGGLMCDFIPWICDGNKALVSNFLAQTRAKVCFGHFQLQGFEMEKGSVCMEGLPVGDLANYTRVYSGHFHHRSSDTVGRINYIGSPGEITWGDYEDERGFTVFDTETLQTQFIKNPYKLHVKVQFDGNVETLESVKNHDYSQYKEKILKVLVSNKVSAPLYEKFLKSIEAAGPIEVQVIESFVDTSEEITIDESDDTNSLIGKFIDSVEMPLNKDILKEMVNQIYKKAQTIDDIRDVKNASDI